MALREVVQFPDPRLKKVSEPITEVTDEIRELARDMIDVQSFTESWPWTMPLGSKRVKTKASTNSCRQLLLCTSASVRATK